MVSKSEFCNHAGYARGVNWILSLRIWAPIARVSYSAYLIQFAGLFVGKYISYGAGDSVGLIFGKYLGFCLGGFGVVFLISLGVYLLVEKPVMGLR